LSPSVEAVARQREVDRAEITEGGSTRIYGEMMRILDAGIGRLMTVVEPNPTGRDTFVIFTSDNGGERFPRSGRSSAANLTCWKAGSGCRRSAGGRVAS
jgi:arylsulfatase A-like enzyme